MKRVTYKMRYESLKEAIKEDYDFYSNALSEYHQGYDDLTDFIKGYIDGHLDLADRLLMNIKMLDSIRLTDERKDEKKTKSSDFYPCADENGMVGR